MPSSSSFFSFVHEAFTWLGTYVVPVLVIALYIRARKTERQQQMPVTQSHLLADIAARKQARTQQIADASTTVNNCIETAAANGQPLDAVQAAVADFDASVQAGVNGLVTSAQNTVAGTPATPPPPDTTGNGSGTGDGGSGGGGTAAG